MYLRITGKSKKIAREEVRAAAYFFARKLMPLRLTDLLTISIIFKPNLWRDEQVIGKCTCWDELLTPRKFRLCLDPHEPRHHILSTLAHEFVHVKQYASGEMRDYYYHERTKYRGKYFPFPDIDDDKVYWNSPWEKEAHSKDIKLRKRFLKYLDKHGLKSYHK